MRRVRQSRSAFDMAVDRFLRSNWGGGRCRFCLEGAEKTALPGPRSKGFLRLTRAESDGSHSIRLSTAQAVCAAEVRLARVVFHRPTL